MQTSEDYEKLFPSSSKTSSKFEIVSEEIDEDEVIEIIEKEERSSKMEITLVDEEEKSTILTL